MEQIRLDWSAADLVLMGKVQSLGPSPGIWSSMLLIWQEVHYEVGVVYKHPPDLAPPSGTLIVRHLLVQGSPTARKDKPELDPAFFAEGRSLVLFLKRETDGYSCLHPDHGAVPADDGLLAQLQSWAAGPG